MSPFYQANLLAYFALVNAFLDAVIWCLGPYVDDSRPYGPARRALARATRFGCRLWMGRRGRHEP